MPIPDFQTLMLPVLKISSDGEIHYIHDAVDELSAQFSLTEDEKSRLLPSGQQPIFYNRVGWARTYLKKAGLVEDPKRGYFQITDRGKEVLGENPSRIDMRFLKQFPEYIEFKQRPREITEPGDDDGDFEGLTPEEALEEAYQRIRGDLSNEILIIIWKQ